MIGFIEVAPLVILSNCSYAKKELIGELILNDSRTLDVRGEKDFFILCNSSTELDSVYKISSGSFTKRTISKFHFKTPNELHNIPSYFLYGCQYLDSIIVLPPNVEIIGSHFLGNCNAFNSDVDLNDVRSIDDNFMCNNYNFNSNVMDLNGVESIGKNFLYGCKEFNQQLDMSTVKCNDNNIYLPAGFLQNCYKMVQKINFGNLTAGVSVPDTVLAMDNDTCVAYTTGIKIDGDDKVNIKNSISDRDVNPYRKTIVV
jgi:hypothetical protein